MNPYETDKLLAEYLLFHYGEPDEILPHPHGPREALGYPQRCVSELLDLRRLPENARALDLGCAVGRSTFELARHCASVLGVDFSQRFIDAAAQLQQAGALAYRRTEEGDLFTPLTAHIAADIDRSRVRFEQGDAMNLRADIGDFDLVLMANLIDRLAEPRRCLARLASLVRPGGQLIITSPYTWLEEWTPREHWLGGFERDGQPVATLDGLRAALAADFEFLGTAELPFLIREHRRKFQWSVAQASRWVRRGGPPASPARGREAREWEADYRAGDTPWDKGTPHPALVDFLAAEPIRGRVLAPGCGRGHDVRALAATAEEVVGIDIAPSAVEAARAFQRAGAEQFETADLFALPAEMRGAFDWLWEHTCFCAIDPTQRPAYVEAVAGALRPGGHLLAVFYLDPGQDRADDGPPFETSLSELDRLFSPRFELVREWPPARTFPGREEREWMRLLRVR